MFDPFWSYAFAICEIHTDRKVMEHVPLCDSCHSSVTCLEQLVVSSCIQLRKWIIMNPWSWQATIYLVCWCFVLKSRSIILHDLHIFTWMCATCDNFGILQGLRAFFFFRKSQAIRYTRWTNHKRNAELMLCHGLWSTRVQAILRGMAWFAMAIGKHIACFCWRRQKLPPTSCVAFRPRKILRVQGASSHGESWVYLVEVHRLVLWVVFSGSFVFGRSEGPDVASGDFEHILQACWKACLTDGLVEFHVVQQQQNTKIEALHAQETPDHQFVLG